MRQTLTILVEIESDDTQAAVFLARAVAETIKNERTRYAAVASVEANLAEGVSMELVRVRVGHNWYLNAR